MTESNEAVIDLTGDNRKIQTLRSVKKQQYDAGTISRSTITFHQKLQIIDLFKDKKSAREIKSIKEFNHIAISTINKLRKPAVQQRIFNEAKKCPYPEGSAQYKKFLSERSKASSPAYVLIEESTVEWIINARQRNVPLSQELIGEKAREIKDAIIKMLNEKGEDSSMYDSFVGSISWVKSTLERRNLKIYKLHGESASVKVDEVAAGRTAIRTKLSEWADKLDCVYNCDETAFFYRMLPEKSVSNANYSNGVKKNKDRLTLLLCCNYDGTDNLPLLVIGKSKEPRDLKNFNFVTNEIKYVNQAHAWMTKEIFKNWLLGVNQKMAADERHILLLMDNVSSHYVTGEVALSHVTVFFLPPNTSSHLQPLDQGIIASFKAHYRKHFLQHVLHQDRIHQHKLSVDKLLPRMNCALEMASKSWRDVLPSTIKNCWRHAGFIPLGALADENQNTDSTSSNVTLPSDAIFSAEVNVINELLAQLNVTKKLKLPADNILSDFVHYEETNLICTEPECPVELYSDKDLSVDELANFAVAKHMIDVSDDDDDDDEGEDEGDVEDVALLSPPPPKRNGLEIVDAFINFINTTPQLSIQPNTMKSIRAIRDLEETRQFKCAKQSNLSSFFEKLPLNDVISATNNSVMSQSVSSSSNSQQTPSNAQQIPSNAQQIPSNAAPAPPPPRVHNAPASNQNGMAPSHQYPGYLPASAWPRDAPLFGGLNNFAPPAQLPTTEPSHTASSTTQSSSHIEANACPNPGETGKKRRRTAKAPSADADGPSEASIPPPMPPPPAPAVPSRPAHPTAPKGIFCCVKGCEAQRRRTGMITCSAPTAICGNREYHKACVEDMDWLIDDPFVCGYCSAPGAHN
jgi:hypothetical protein